ncbi:MAG: SDR family oxidoreductase [Spirochaetes bacterium]|nr:SDR family oxidoreductase [Spirochaetota bacterium]
MKLLIGKTVLITGAASGIGKEMALQFAKEKSHLVLIDINKQKLLDTAQKAQEYGVRVTPFICDMANHKAIEKTATLIKKTTSVDVLINNAGIVIGKPIVDFIYREIKKTIDVNLLGLMWMTKQFLPAMIAQKSGHIVNIASAAGLLAVPRMADYCATKFAVVGFTDSLRMEMKKYGHPIAVTCVCPSVIDTGMFAGFKAPMFNPVLKPNYVAKKVVDAVKKEKTYVKIPAMVRIIPLIKFFPAPVGDWLAHVTGVTKAMDTFIGH